jgi:hypothetical protein
MNFGRYFCKNTKLIGKNAPNAKKYHPTPKISPKWRNFARSGHTAGGPLLRLNTSKVSVASADNDDDHDNNADHEHQDFSNIGFVRVNGGIGAAL